jgi:phage-related holin
MISIVENAGLMGIPLPEIITKAIEVLKHKSEGEDK